MGLSLLSGRGRLVSEPHGPLSWAGPCQLWSQPRCSLRAHLIAPAGRKVPRLVFSRKVRVDTPPGRASR